ncbi:unnamed protein product [Blepharisma stoltei]|uniref:Uncharacterized protein n=1 Tax=Blepharisma stoltei TaxID=1481888 RepID=A0AAU9JYC9_9CILI|nr:unnamed protein product [Blepharisma stoltei]
MESNIKVAILPKTILEPETEKSQKLAILENNTTQAGDSDYLSSLQFDKILNTEIANDYIPTKENNAEPNEDPYNIDILMQKKGSELNKALEEIRKQNLYNAACKLKSMLPSKGRCPICTLKLPCKHYSSTIEIKPASRGRSHSPMTSFTCLSETPKSSNVTQIHFSPEPREFYIRYRKINGNSAEVTRRPKEKGIDREYQKLKVLEKIEKYREEKLKKEIEIIEELKRVEEQEIVRQKRIEEKQKQYYERQKQRLKEYHEELKRPKEIETIRALVNDKKLKKREEMRRKYVEEQKRKIDEYHQKKRMIDGIIQDQISELEKAVLKPKKMSKSLKSSRNNKL